jgi:hypothetical protein
MHNGIYDIAVAVAAAAAAAIAVAALLRIGVIYQFWWYRHTIFDY